MSLPAPREFAVFAFATTHDALDAEALLGDLGFEVVPVPAPPDLSANCGIALRVPPEDGDRAATYLDRAGIEVVRRATILDV